MMLLVRAVVDMIESKRKSETIHCEILQPLNNYKGKDYFNVAIQKIRA